MPWNTASAYMEHRSQHIQA